MTGPLQHCLKRAHNMRLEGCSREQSKQDGVTLQAHQDCDWYSYIFEGLGDYFSCCHDVCMARMKEQGCEENEFKKGQRWLSSAKTRLCSLAEGAPFSLTGVKSTFNCKVKFIFIFTLKRFCLLSFRKWILVLKQKRRLAIYNSTYLEKLPR